MRLDRLETVFRTLNDAHVRYLVAGGVAVIAHGYLRFTKDLDLIVALDPPNAGAAMRALGSLGYRPKVPVPAGEFADPAKRERWRTEKQMLVFQMISDSYQDAPIDVFVTAPFDFDAEWNRAPRFELSEDIAVPIVSLDRLLEMKRAAGRDTDKIDVAMLTRQPPTKGKKPS